MRNRNILTQKLQTITVGARLLQNKKFCAVLLNLIMIVGIFSASLAFSSLMISVSVKSNGLIFGEFAGNVTATSGSAKDIQAAVDLVVAHGGVGNVYIPEGTFDFVEVGEGWSSARVNIPAGVNLFGEPTERDANGQVIQWKTVLRLPWDVPGSWLGGSGTPPANGGPAGVYWFRITGNSDPTKPSRFSDIKLEGYRVIDPNSKMIIKGLYIRDVVDFRVDHCYFEEVAGGAITTTGLSCRGVIDHSKFINHQGDVTGDWYNFSVGYGISVDRAVGDYWETDVSQILGKYTDYSVYIEDCYLEKWRYPCAAANGAHMILRHSMIQFDFGYGAVDAHGRGAPGVQVGTRAVEVYENTITDSYPYEIVVKLRGGSGVIFNNVAGGGQYDTLVWMTNEQPDNPKIWCNDIWIWNNTLLAGVSEVYVVGSGIVEDVNYFLHAPHTFEYEPYSYPHPLTL